jgi:hypothetical protein
MLFVSLFLLFSPCIQSIYCRPLTRRTHFWPK